MASLEHVGRYPDSDYAVMHRQGVDGRFQQVAVSQADVDAIVTPERNQLVLPSYVQAQDALLARKSYVDAQDNNYELRTARGAANGIATLGSDGKVPSTQMPDLRDYAPLYYFTTTPSGNSWSATSTTRTYHQYTFSDPGYPYVLLVFVHIGAISSGNWSHPFVEVRIGSEYGTVISHGFGTEAQHWNWIKALPASNSGNAGVKYTGSQTIYVRGGREAGTADVQFTQTGFSFSVVALPSL